MSFLDRFKPQPRWKHADATVRVGAVGELMTDDPEHQRALVELAGTDDDVRVRRAAVARIDGVEDLVQLARSEKDEDLRRTLTDRLLAVATAAAPADGDAARALDGLDDQKQLATVAKSSPHDTVRTAALGRVQDVRCLSSVARHAVDPEIALEAATRVSDPAELLNIALKTDHKDAGLAALDRILGTSLPADVRSTLDLVAARAKNKSVAKRARTTLQGIEETEAAQRAALEQWRQRVAAVLARVAALAAAPVAGETRVQLADAEADWLELAGSGTFAVDPDTNARFGALVTDAHGAIERYDQEQAERRAADERRASLRAEKQALCERVEALRGEEALEALELARGEWEGLINRADSPDATPTPTCTPDSTPPADRQPSGTPTVRPSSRRARASTRCRSTPSAPRRPSRSTRRRGSRWPPSGRLSAASADGLDAATSERFSATPQRRSHSTPRSGRRPRSAWSGSRCSGSNSWSSGRRRAPPPKI